MAGGGRSPTLKMRCEQCGAEGAKHRCSRCLDAHYCNTVCQRTHWKAGHKVKCCERTAAAVCHTAAAGQQAAGQEAAATAGPAPTPSAPGAGAPAAAAAAAAGEGGEECAICLDVLQQPQTMPCGHRFCRGCVASMREHGVGEAQVCPLCRGVMPDVERLACEGSALLTQHYAWRDRHQRTAQDQQDQQPQQQPPAPPALPPPQQQLLRRAEAAYRQVLSVDSGAGAQMRGNLAVCLHSRGDRTGAEEEYRRALRLEPGHAHTSFNLGTLLEEGGTAASAAAAYDAYRIAVTADPAHARAHFNLGNILLGRRDVGGAERAFRAAAAADPQCAQAHANLGSLLLCHKSPPDVPGAEAALRAAVAADPRDAGALLNLGAIAINARGDLRGGARLLAAALKLQPGNAIARQNLETVLRALHRDSPAADG